MTELKLNAQPHVKAYYQQIMDQTEKAFGLATRAKESGRDISTVVESKPAVDLADRCENISGPVGIAKRFREIFEEQKGNRMNAIYQVFREIMEGKFGNENDREKRLDQAVRTAMVLVTEGVVVAPLDGVSAVKISKNFDGSEYVDIYYAGPIRAAGGTATVFPLILGDYAIKILGIDRYKPTEEEVERYVEEMKLYEEIFSRQYKMSEEEVRTIARNCPVCINGEPTEDKEVSVHKNLPRVPSNRVRGAVCLVLSEGVALKASKILSMTKKLGLDWQWLDKFIKVSKSGEGGKETKLQPNKKFLERLAAGRPILSYPLKEGGFRLRYGRTRNTGIMAKAIHPATMHLTDDFIAVGTQMKVERPGKSAGIFPCDSIEGPIVKLKNGNVEQIKTLERAIAIRPFVKEILYLGDMLVSLGDFRKSAHPLCPAGYCPEWWALELEKMVTEQFPADITTTEHFWKDPEKITPMEAVALSIHYNIPLHPHYTGYYEQLNASELKTLMHAAFVGKKEFAENQVNCVLIENTDEIKLILEKTGISHQVTPQGLTIDATMAYPFLKTVNALGSEDASELVDPSKKVIENLQIVSGLRLREKSGTFIGARMGRPEAAKPRKMVGNPHVLFPIGMYGGNIRSLTKAGQTNEKGDFPGIIEAEMTIFLCPKCNQHKHGNYCYGCHVRTIPKKTCPECKSLTIEDICPNCKVKTNYGVMQKIPLSALLHDAEKNIGTRAPEIIKGVKGLISLHKQPEPIEKGILRSQQDLHIFRDGTIRFEMLNAPLSHFRLREFPGLTIERAKELGYTQDWEGKPIENNEQIIELFPQDIVINEDSAEFFVRVGKFIDDLLVKFYGVEPFYHVKKKEDLIGHLTLGLAPHTSAAIVGRILGFSKGRVCFGHPFYHLCKRRNIDGDQDSVMLLMDGLLNFSEKYLAGSRGGRMDAPLVFTIALNPQEIDDEAYEMETVTRYTTEFYEKTQEIGSPMDIPIPRIFDVLGKETQYTGLNFTHDTTLFDAGPKQSTYTRLVSMDEKIEAQAAVQEKIRCVNKKDALERVMVSHFLPDIIGNARAFSRQLFRCTKCNEKYRRIPLVGKCEKCGGNLILTIAQGSVKKYLEIAKRLVNQYQLSPYLGQRLELVEEEIASLFEKEKKEQKSLFNFV